MGELINKIKLNNTGLTVPNYLFKGNKVKYYGDFSVNVAFLDKKNNWKNLKSNVLEPDENSFDKHSLTVIETVLTARGIMVVYDSSYQERGIAYLNIGLAFFDPKKPDKLIWRNESPFYSYEVKTDEDIIPNETIFDGEEMILTWKLGVEEEIEVRIPHPYIHLDTGSKKRSNLKKQFEVKRYYNNPIIKPKEENNWETKATFNPAALYTQDKIHLVYRAIGTNDVSVLGYASSRDGFNIKERLNYPIFLNRRGGKNIYNKDKSEKSPISYISGGGGEGGCEDPRITLIDDTVYLTYTSFDGWGSLRMALTSISLKDFLDHEWNWEKPIMISPPGEIHKNWVLFPEKINGKFAVLHSISPDISIEYLEDLKPKKEKRYIKSFFSSVANLGRWDSKIRGAGPPPIKTSKGWLLLYHAMDVFSDPDKYKLGAMLLDLKNPQKIIARSKEPILEPNEDYENDGWKAGVSYSCGAVKKGNKLLIYYGGADTVTCVAGTNLNIFVKELLETGKPKINKLKH